MVSTAVKGNILRIAFVCANCRARHNGEISASETLPAAVQALSLPQLKLVLVGDQHQTALFCCSKWLLSHPRVRLVHASQVVGMGEKPIVALRTLKDSSMRVTPGSGQERRCRCLCVSAGNTGALMAIPP